MGRIDSECRLNAQTLILAPPEVKRFDTPEGPIILYPVPDSWRQGVCWIEPRKLKDVGWKYRQNHSGLLDDFIRLERANFDEVARFAKTWGPLWICGHDSHRHCFLSGWPRESSCVWAPGEEAAEFVQMAQQANFILQEAAPLLKAGSPSPMPPPNTPGLDTYGWDVLDEAGQVNALLALQKETVETTANRYLEASGKVSLRMEWIGAGPRLRFSTPLGFVPAVWMQIAQKLCSAKGIYQCAECGDIVLVHQEGKRKRPPAGQRFFCSECGKRASKRQWAERNRSKKG